MTNYHTIEVARQKNKQSLSTALNIYFPLYPGNYANHHVLFKSEKTYNTAKSLSVASGVSDNQHRSKKISNTIKIKLYQ